MNDQPLRELKILLTKFRESAWLNCRKSSSPLEDWIRKGSVTTQMKMSKPLRGLTHLIIFKTTHKAMIRTPTRISSNNERQLIKRMYLCFNIGSCWTIKKQAAATCTPVTQTENWKSRLRARFTWSENDQEQSKLLWTMLNAQFSHYKFRAKRTTTEVQRRETHPTWSNSSNSHPNSSCLWRSN